MNKEYSIPELKKMLQIAEFRVNTLEVKVRALTNQIIEMGGQPPSDDELEKMSRQLADKEAEANEVKAMLYEEETKSEFVDDSWTDAPEM